jgi:predicted nucleotidyltransferase
MGSERDPDRPRVTAATWAVTPEKIAAVVASLAEFAHPSRIIVFGSAARGELHRDSDLDLLVIMHDDVADWTAESVRLRRHVHDILMAMDILVISEAEAARALNNRYGVLGPALREGKLAYEAGR